jgi:hypothetical protein
MAIDCSDRQVTDIHAAMSYTSIGVLVPFLTASRNARSARESIPPSQSGMVYGLVHAVHSLIAFMWGMVL